MSDVRPDGRSSSSTLRPLTCELSCLNRADGSALWKAGSSHVLAAVYGPIAPAVQAKERNTTTVTVLIKSGKASGQAIGMEREWELFLTEVLSACIDCSFYPRTVVEVVLQVIQDDGSLLACLLHASVAALMDGGVAMKTLPVATSFLLVDDKSSTTNQSMLLDPTLGEENQADSSMLVLVTDNSTVNNERILGSHTVGTKVSLSTVLTCMQAAARATPAVVTFWRLAIEHKVTKESQTLWSN